MKASKALPIGLHKYVIFKGKQNYQNYPAFILKEITIGAKEETQHSDLAEITIAYLAIPMADPRYFMDDFMGAGTCESNGKNIKWVDGITGSMNSSDSKEFSLAIQNGVELI